MEAVILVSIVFVGIAQAIGLIVYYSKRNQYSKSAQNVATFLPAAVFMLLAVLGSLLWILLAWWAEVGGLRARLLEGSPSLLMWIGMYVFGGGLANIFLSILVQLILLLIYPPKFKSRRRRRRAESTHLAL